MRASEARRLLEMLNPIPDERAIPERGSGAVEDWEEMMESLPRSEVSSGSRPARNAPRRAILGAAAAIAVAVAVVAGFAVSDPSPASASGLRVERTTGSIVATVTDLNADPGGFAAAFHEAGLEISLDLVPASPSVVGSIVAIGGTGDGIRPLSDDGCPTENRCGPIGIVIPPDFSGHAHVTLARSARPGETFSSTGSPFAPGELLRCMAHELLGKEGSEVVRLLRGRALTAQWRDATGREISRSQADGRFATGFTLLDSDTVVVFTSERPDPTLAAAATRFDSGCAPADLPTP